MERDVTASQDGRPVLQIGPQGKDYIVVVVVNMSDPAAAS